MITENRKFMRFSVNLKARYMHETRWHDCSVVNVSREGMELALSAGSGIDRGTTVETEVLFPPGKQPIKLAGQIVHVQQPRDNASTQVKAGIKLTQIDAADKWDLLDTAYNDWYSKTLEKGEQTSRQIGR
jgi:hypothetical protein